MSIQQTTAKITLDLYTKNVVSVNAKQYDNQTRYIEISCVENGIVFTVDKSIMSAFIRLKNLMIMVFLMKLKLLPMESLK